MNITLSADKDLIEGARRYAQEHGTSLNQLIRDHLRRLVGDSSPDDLANEFLALAQEYSGDSSSARSRGRPWSGREDLYAERLDRYGRR